MHYDNFIKISSDPSVSQKETSTLGPWDLGLGGWRDCHVLFQYWEFVYPSRPLAYFRLSISCHWGSRRLRPETTEEKMFSISITRPICRICVLDALRSRSHLTIQRSSLRRSLHVTSRAFATPPPMVNVRWGAYWCMLKIRLYRSES